MSVHFRRADETRFGGVDTALASINDFQDASYAKRSLYLTLGKRLFDILFVVLLAPIALGLVAFGAGLAMLSGVRPFFWQKRIGKDGQVFEILKIRTMVEDADAQLKRYLAENPEARREWEFKQKLEDDPRVIRFGCLLRQTSLDELPQLWNVLKGDMSIVGPRPITVEQQSMYFRRECYDAMRPGITGLWQISNRGKGSFAVRVSDDCKYYNTISLKEDLRILWKTVGAVLNRTGR